MTIKAAVNGYRPIGRAIVRAHDEDGSRHDLQIVAVDDLGDAKTSAGWTGYDSTRGRSPGTWVADGDPEDIRCARHQRARREHRRQPHDRFGHRRYVADQGVGAPRQRGGLVRQRVGLQSSHARLHRRADDGQAKWAPI